jgi:hypothetical protein
MLRSIAGVTAFVLQASVLAADTTVVPDHRWTLRGDFVINTASDPLPGDAVLAVSLARRLGRHLAVEATVGPGLPSTMLARDASGATREVDTGSGLHAALLLRAHRTLTSSGRSSLSLAAGPSLVSGEAFGTVPMVRAELGFDLRFRRKWIFFYGIGYESSLKTSRTPFAASECFTSGACPPQYRSGTGQVTSRVGIGLTF